MFCKTQTCDYNVFYLSQRYKGESQIVENVPVMPGYDKFSSENRAGTSWVAFPRHKFFKKANFKLLSRLFF